MLEVSTSLVLGSVELDTDEDAVELSEPVAVGKFPVPVLVGIGPLPVPVGPPYPLLKEYGERGVVSLAHRGSPTASRRAIDASAKSRMGRSSH